MKRLFCFIFVIVIIASLIYPLFVYSVPINESGQFICEIYSKKKSDLNEISIIYKKGYKIIHNVIDLYYNERDKTVHYTQHLKNGKKVYGTVLYNEVFFNTPNGYLFYDKHWYYRDNRTNGTYLIKDNKNCDMVKFSIDPMDW